MTKRRRTALSPHRGRPVRDAGSPKAARGGRGLWDVPEVRRLIAMVPADEGLTAPVTVTTNGRAWRVTLQAQRVDFDVERFWTILTVRDDQEPT